MFHSIMLQFFYTKKKTNERKKFKSLLILYSSANKRANVYEVRERERETDLARFAEKKTLKRNENETVVPLKS
jgi:hypothetical protein